MARVIYKLTKAEKQESRSLRKSGFKDKRLPTTESLPAISRVFVKDDNGNTIQRKIRYCPYEQSIFMDEQDPQAHTKKIRFENGFFTVDPELEPLIYQFMETIDSNGSKVGRNPKKKALFVKNDPVAKARKKLQEAEALQAYLSSFWTMTEKERQCIAEMWGIKTIDKKPEIWQQELFTRANEHPEAFKNIVESGDLPVVEVIVRSQRVAILKYNQNWWEFNGTRIAQVPHGVNRTVAIMNYLQAHQDTFLALKAQTEKRENRLQAKTEVQQHMEAFTPAEILDKGMENIGGDKVLIYHKGKGWAFRQPYEPLGDNQIFGGKNNKEVAIEFIAQNEDVQAEIFTRREELFKLKAEAKAAKEVNGE